MLSRYCFLFAIVIARSAVAEQLIYGDAKEFNAISYLYTRSPDFESGGGSEIVSISVDPRSIDIVKDICGYNTLRSDDLIQKGKPGDPVTYLKTATLALKKNARVTGAEIISGTYVEIKNRLDFRPVPQLYAPGEDPARGGTLERSSVYDKNDWYPKKTVSFISGKDGRNVIVHVQVYPVQYNPVMHASVVITDAVVRITYREDDPEEVPPRLKPYFTDAEGIILTSDGFAAAAESLKAVHEDLNKLKCGIITTQYISANFGEAPDPTEKGYANKDMKSKVTKYNFSLAKKIIAFLRDTPSHPNLRFLTILGDADIVPPGYYFHDGDFYNELDECIASDLYYASPDYDLVQNIAVGRLTVSNAAEAFLISQKIKLWQSSVKKNGIGEVQLIAGLMRYNSEDFLCESAHAYNSGKNFFSGMKIGKNFRSNNRENVQSIAPYFTDEKTGIIVHLGHGNGKALRFAEECFSPSDIIASKPSVAPLLFSISCYNGGYDMELAGDTSKYGANCFGEKALRSNAGCIGYWGGNRANLCGSDNYFDVTGRLIAVDGLKYIGKIFSYCFQRYSQGDSIAGTFTKNALDCYVAQINENDIWEKISLYQFVFLGDPAIRLPSLKKGAAYTKPKVKIHPLPHSAGANYFIKDGCSPQLSFFPFSDALSIDHRIIEFTKAAMDTTLVTLVKSIPNGSSASPLSFQPAANGKYMYICENPDGKEERIFLKTKMLPGTDIPPTPVFMYDAKLTADFKYLFSWSPSVDFDGAIPSYTIREISNVRSGADSCNSFDYWDTDFGRLSNPGHNSGTSFRLPKGAEIATVVPVTVSNGAKLSFWVKGVPENSVKLGIWAFDKVTNGFSQYPNIGMFFDAVTTKDWEYHEIDLSKFYGSNGTQIFLLFKIYNGDDIPDDAFCLIDDISSIGIFDFRNVEHLPDTSYLWTGTPPKECLYQVKAVASNGVGSRWSNLLSPDKTTQSEMHKEKNGTISFRSYFNPSASRLIIYYELSATSAVDLTLFDLHGRTVAFLKNKLLPAGKKTVQWNLNHTAGGSGLYILRINQEHRLLTQIVKVMQ